MPGALMHWSAAYVGIPWRPEAEGPDAFDCKGLVRHVLPLHLGRPAPRVIGAGRPEDWAAVRDSIEHDGWKRLPDGTPAEEGDIVVLKGRRGHHVAVVIQGGRRPVVLHSEGCEDEHGSMRGAASVEQLRDLLSGRYARPQLWRHA